MTTFDHMDNTLLHAVSLFEQEFGARPAAAAQAPGRVNIIGEHVDYAGGLCLPFAIDRTTAVAVAPRTDTTCRLVSALPGGETMSATTTLEAAGRGELRGDFAGYAAGVAWALAEAGHGVGGFDAAVASRVPVGAGVSSSAALECSIALALDAGFELGLGGDDAGRETLAGACIRAENHAAGAATGGLDQTVSLFARQSHALLIDFTTHQRDHIAGDVTAAGAAWLVVDSRVAHELAGDEFASLRSAAERAADTLAGPISGSARYRSDQVMGTQTLSAACRNLQDLSAHEQALRTAGDAAYNAAHHVHAEDHRTRACAGLLASLADVTPPRRGEIATELGGHLVASHESLRGCLRVSCVELDVAVAAATQAGAYGARMMGGGFGGSMLALVPEGATRDVLSACEQAYAQRGWAEPRGFVATPAGAAQAAVL